METSAADRLITCLPCDLFHPPSFEHFLQVNARGQGGSLPIGGAGAGDSLGSGTVQVSVPVSYIFIHTNALQKKQKHAPMSPPPPTLCPLVFHLRSSLSHALWGGNLGSRSRRSTGWFVIQNVVVFSHQLSPHQPLCSLASCPLI